MRVVLGVKDYGSAHQALDLIQALKFDSLEVYPVHILEYVGGVFGKSLLTIADSEYYTHYLNTQKALAHELVTGLEQELKRRDMSGQVQLREGYIANQLILATEERHGDVLFVTLERPVGLERMAFGAVGRKLVFQSSHSLYVYKPGRSSTSLRRAIFATDHSEYADRALDHLIQWKPRGIEDITVLTAFPENLTSALAPFIGRLGLDFGQVVGEKLKEKNEQIAQRLRDVGFKARAEVLGENVHEAIDNSCRRHQAGLVIVGAQGHGMLEGLALGSVASHLAFHTDHSVLILRP
ncbi:MAG: universal stress protein [Proteobacteria bacterium]|nr:universal stress protein [Pseudomonadota bacterium]